jgi:multiple sugar transport system permease protein
MSTAVTQPREATTARHEAPQNVPPRRSLLARLLAGPLPWVLPALLVIVGVQLFPMGYAAWLSLYRKYALSPVGHFAGLGNYKDLLTDPEFWSAARFGVIYAVLAVVCQLALAIPLALLVHRSFRGRSMARGLLILPYMVPTASMALVFAFMMNDLYGVVNKVLLDIGVIDHAIPFYGDPKWVLPAVLLASTWKWMPFALIVILARLQTIDQSLYECARVEGAGPWRQFLDVTLPSLRSTILLVVMLRSIWMFNKFDIPYLVTNGGPGNQTTNLPIHAYDVTFLDGQQGQGAALAVLMFVLLLAFALIYAAIVKPEREVITE